MSASARVGVDVGGTFTDLVLYDPVRAITRTAKLLTTPDDPCRAIVEGVRRLLRDAGLEARELAGIVHGTTLITNTVLERTGARVGLLATRGFRDVLEMGRESRYDVDDLFMPPVPVLVPRDLRRTVEGRMLADGSEYTPLDEAAVLQEVAWLVEQAGIESLAIAFLHAFRNPAHELRARELIRRRYPDLFISLSSEVASEIREYERTNTACVNAYVQPRVHGYLGRLSEALGEAGFRGDLRIMLSGGGVTTVEDARRFPVRLIESGPAAGAIAAAYLARRAGESRVISFDMGGTTAKMCLIDEGLPRVKREFEAGRIRKFLRGSGLPLQVTVIDMIEIGSGGGSIAGVGADGLMKVGPRSAGSSPGPVAYGRGGTEPTVTDADLLLGYLDPGNFLGGDMQLALRDVEAAVALRLAPQLGTSSQRAAAGVRAIVDESMAAATRMHLAEMGRDPRDYTLIAFGGAGPVHAYALARLLGVRRLLVPMGAGVASALGFLVAPPAVDEVRGYVTELGAADWEHVRGLFADMEARGRATLPPAGEAGVEAGFRWSADMRYLGQGFELEVELPRGALGADAAESLREAFHQAYAQRFDRIVRDVDVEVVNWRVHAFLPGADISLAYRAGSGSAVVGTRRVHFEGFGELEARIHDRYALRPGTLIRGPAVVEERESSCGFGPDCECRVDEDFNLVIRIDAAMGERA